jgi:hypothetical protein
VEDLSVIGPTVLKKFSSHFLQNFSSRHPVFAPIIEYIVEVLYLEDSFIVRTEIFLFLSRVKGLLYSIFFEAN